MKIDISQEFIILGAAILIGLVIIITILTMIIQNSGEDLTRTPTSIHCCNGGYCTDVYYNEKDNLCHYVFCERDYLINNFGNKNCTTKATLKS